MKKIEEKIINKISKILNVNKKELLTNKKFSKFDEWDSLKHLEIITILDTFLEKKKKNNINFSKLDINKLVLLTFTRTDEFFPNISFAAPTSVTRTGIPKLAASTWEYPKPSNFWFKDNSKSKFKTICLLSCFKNLVKIILFSNLNFLISFFNSKI